MIDGSAAIVGERSPPPSCISTIAPGWTCDNTRDTMVPAGGRW
jgi:hypothetical protein